MNETECEDLIKSVKWTEPSNLISLAILEFINVLVIGGNLLVIAAVFCSNKLRSVTNFFIVNLAVADLLVGLAVLPFSATWEVFKVWIFGDVWCRIWLAVDVWMCTASILNLCAISLDRYVAVTRPVTYPSIMSTKRAKSLIAGIWVLSFVICFPPLVGWKDQKPLAQPITYTRGNYTLYYATTSTKATTTTTTTAAAAAASTTSRTSSITSPSLSLTSPSLSSFADWSAKTAEQKLKLRQQNTYAASTAHNLPPTPVKASVYNDFSPYDPYHAHLSNNNNTSTSNNAMNNYDNNNNDDNNDDDDDNDDNTDNDGISDDVDASVGIEDVYALTPDAQENILYNNRPSLSSSTLLYDDSGMDDTTLVSSSKFDLKETQRETERETATATATATGTGTTSTLALPCPWKCELTNDRGYVLYSALGSFYIPMFVMLFFYWRIYRAAVRTTRAINQGFKTTKGGHESHTNRPDETQLVLRIHRGRPCTTTQRTPLSMHSMSSMLSVNSNGDETLYGLQHSQLQQQSSSNLILPKRATSMRLTKQKHEKVTVKVSFPSSDNMMESGGGGGGERTITTPTFKALTVHEGVAASSAMQKTLSLTNGQRGSFKSSLCNIGETTFNNEAFTSTDTSTMALNHQRDDVEIVRDSSQKQDKKQRGKRSVRFQVKRFKVETKAAKTLAIIVGGFIFCWLPFFTMYLIRAFCDHCIPATLFSVLFWLGYCNSAINPVIYALFSHEFRIAFKRIVCRCVCTRSGFRASENFQMIAARALMAPATFHKTISGCSDDGDGDGDADGDGDGPDFS